MEYGEDVPGGVPCYVCAVWYNERGEWSPASDPVTIYLSAPGASAIEGADSDDDGEADLKIAA